MRKRYLEPKDVPKSLIDNLDKQKQQADLLELRALQSAYAIPYFSEKEEYLIINLLQSMPYESAYRNAGYTKRDLTKIEDFLSQKSVAKIIFYFKEKKQANLNLTREKLSEMAMECYRERLTAMEGIRAIEVLSRLWGLNKESAGSRITINNQQNTANLNNDTKQNSNYLKSLSTDELKKLASNKLNKINIESDTET